MDLYYSKAGDQRGTVKSGPSLNKRIAVFPLRSAKQVRQLGDVRRYRRATDHGCRCADLGGCRGDLLLVLLWPLGRLPWP